MSDEKVQVKKAPIVEKVEKLVNLALDEDTEEARTAAMKAIKLIDEHKLTFITPEQLESARKAIEGARELAKRGSEERMQNILLGAALGYFGGKQFG